MASINISEDDFTSVAMAAHLAKQDGDMPLAANLDKIARKINAALTNSRVSLTMKIAGCVHKPLTWRDVPSTLEDLPC